MERKLSRRAFVSGTVASAVAVGTGAASSTADIVPAARDLHVGTFVGSTNPRTAQVRLPGAGADAEVQLDSGAFVAHGADGVVDGFASFVPGERVVIRGALVGGRIVATDCQSLYEGVEGTLVADGSGYTMQTPMGESVQVPQAVVDRAVGQRIPGGVRPGAATYGATIWTHPVTGDAVAVVIDDEV